MDISVPQMVCQALGLPSYREEKSQEETRCSFCGGRIAKGDPCKTRALSALSDSFTNDSSLACRTNLACQWCPPLAKKEVLLKTPNSLVTPDGLYGLAKDENRTWFFLTPPSPPWAAFFVTSKMSHVTWRTPLTLDNSLMVMRLDDQILHIRRVRLMQAIDDCKRAGALLAQENGNAASTKKKTKPEFVRNHPFIVLDREAYASQHGQFLPKFIQLADRNEEAAGIASRLELLTKGELFALATLVKGKPVQPVAPQRIALC